MPCLSRPDQPLEETTIDDSYEQLEALEETVDTSDERTEVHRTMRLVDRLAEPRGPSVASASTA